MPASPPVSLPRFDPGLLDGLDEPVRRYFAHAIQAGAPLVGGVRMAMAGRIQVGRWLRFAAREECDGRSFVWRACVGSEHLPLLVAVDRFGAGAGSMDVRLLGRLPLFHAAGADTNRSAAGRLALESVTWSPLSVLPHRGVGWRAESDDHIVADLDVPPERPEVHVRIDERGAIRTVSAARWGNAGRRTFAYVPCGCEVHAERRFGGLVVPSSVTVGWWFGTPRYAPFFEARLSEVTPLPDAG